MWILTAAPLLFTSRAWHTVIPLYFRVGFNALIGQNIFDCHGQFYSVYYVGSQITFTIYKQGELRRSVSHILFLYHDLFRFLILL